MRTVREIAEEIVAREGGFVEDPDDPGGATKFGVTLGTLRRLGIDLDRDGDTDGQDVRRLSKDQATEIYIKHFFVAPGINRLPKPLWATVFDMHVNAGANAIRILQQLLTDMGFDISVDGRIGPQTARIAHRAWREAPEHLVDAYGIARRNYYYALADRRPASRKYARRRKGGKGGWITRAEEFISRKYHLSHEAHLKRTETWA